jgi:hypothetical protein
MTTSTRRRLAANSAVLTRTADEWKRLRKAALATVELTEELGAVCRIRDQTMCDLHRAGFSYQVIALEAGLTRGRVAQIVRRNRG